MVKILGELYYIDFDILDEFLISDETFEAGEHRTQEITSNSQTSTTSTLETITPKNREINGVRYDIIRGFIDDIGAAEADDDWDSLNKMSIRFKLAYNTLLAYDILKKIDE